MVGLSTKCLVSEKVDSQVLISISCSPSDIMSSVNGLFSVLQVWSL